MLRLIIVAACATFLLLSPGYAWAGGFCPDCTISNGQSFGSSVDSGGPRRRAPAASSTWCQTSAEFCLVADAHRRVLTLFKQHRGVAAWDIIMLPPSRTLRGYVERIVYNPSWCPTPGLRRKYPEVNRWLTEHHTNCIPSGNPMDAMGTAKMLLGGDFAGTGIRIHDTYGFGPAWTNEDSSGCVRVLNITEELTPIIDQNHDGVPDARVEVVFHR